MHLKASLFYPGERKKKMSYQDYAGFKSNFVDENDDTKDYDADDFITQGGKAPVKPPSKPDDFLPTRAMGFNHDLNTILETGNEELADENDATAAEPDEEDDGYRIVNGKKISTRLLNRKPVDYDDYLDLFDPDSFEFEGEEVSKDPFFQYRPNLKGLKMFPENAR